MPCNCGLAGDELAHRSSLCIQAINSETRGLALQCACGIPIKAWRLWQRVCDLGSDKKFVLTVAHTADTDRRIDRGTDDLLLHAIALGCFRYWRRATGLFPSGFF